MLLGPTAANRDLLSRARIGVIAPSLSEEDILAGLDAITAEWENFRMGCRAAAQTWNWTAYEPDLAEMLAPPSTAATRATSRLDRPG